MRIKASFLKLWKKDSFTFIEASLYLTAALTALKTIPFRHLEPWFTRPAKARRLSDTERAGHRKKVRQAVLKASRRLPIKATCFTRAMAAQAMLRHRGIGTTLFYGVHNSTGSGLETHVWLKDGSEGIVGHFKSSDYHLLATYQAKEK